MAWRMRRSIKVGPLRFTATNTGISTSVGNKFARVTMNSKGRVTTTQRIPGTGLYNTQTVSTGSTRKRQTRAASSLTPSQAGTPMQESPIPKVIESGHVGSKSDFPLAGWYTDPLGGSMLRSWNGRHWQTELQDVPEGETPPQLSEVFPIEGWYPDPDEAGKECYWYHYQWTTAKRPAGTALQLHEADHRVQRAFTPRVTTYGIFVLLGAIVLTVTSFNGRAAGANVWQSMAYSFGESFGFMFLVTGGYKALTGRPTYFGFPPGRFVGVVMLAIGFALAAMGSAAAPPA